MLKSLESLRNNSFQNDYFVIAHVCTLYSLCHCSNWDHMTRRCLQHNLRYTNTFLSHPFPQSPIIGVRVCGVRACGVGVCVVWVCVWVRVCGVGV